MCIHTLRTAPIDVSRKFDAWFQSLTLAILWLYAVVDVRSHLQQSEKLAVTLKFIDWFTESKLAME